MNKGFAKLGFLVSIVAILVTGVFFASRVFATQTPIENNCDKVCPVVEWTHKYCPDGYDRHENVCRKYDWTPWPGHWEYANLIIGDTFQIPYEKKAQDPHKCHRPSDNDLKFVYGMSNSERSAFKDDHGQYKDFEYEAPDGYYKDGDACYPKTPVCTDPTAKNYDSEVSDTEISDNKVCEYSTRRWCFPDEESETGYEAQAVPENEYPPEVGKPWESGMDRYCDLPDEPEEPTEPEQPSQPSSSSSSTPSAPSAPVCTDGNTINLPANPHVWRNGSSATVNWFQTEGDSANVYYKEVNASGWQHSVRDIKVDNADKFGSVTISNLDPNLGYTFGIQQKKGCGGGETVIAVIIDGPEPELFQFSYWEWAE